MDITFLLAVINFRKYAGMHIVIHGTFKLCVTKPYTLTIEIYTCTCSHACRIIECTTVSHSTIAN